MKTSCQTKKLGDLCSIKTGKRDANHGNPNGKYHFFTCAEKHSYINDYSFDTEAILIAGNGDVGACKYFKGKFDAYQRTYVLSDFVKELNVHFLFLYLNGFLKTFAQAEKQGGTMPYIKLGLLTNLEIRLPTLEEQKRIVAILDEKLGKIAEAKKLREEAIKDTEKILPQTLTEIFEEGKKKGWEEKTIGEMFTLNYGKGLSKLERSTDGKFSVYGANGELGKSNKFLIDGKGLIVGRKGSAGEVTQVDGKYWPTDVTYFVVEDKKYNIDFAFYLFKYLDFTKYAKGVKPGISRNEIYSNNLYYLN